MGLEKGLEDRNSGRYVEKKRSRARSSWFTFAKFFEMLPKLATFFPSFFLFLFFDDKGEDGFLGNGGSGGGVEEEEL